jgi:hypothetical protein
MLDKFPLRTIIPRMCLLSAKIKLKKFNSCHQMEAIKDLIHVHANLISFDLSEAGPELKACDAERGPEQAGM